ncbi:serine/arginine repetitive matrix protein 2-like [Macrobrachium rosenbergii]|uniref:serine/arginine repetitive matrix protein 2-like n=1 Tax=Macrobrachium rosenbergii TaxID=79674 RepID=UPI0034D72293
MFESFMLTTKGELKVRLPPTLRLLKQTNATQLRIPAANPATKTYHDFDERSATHAQTRIYENFLCTWAGVQDGASSLERLTENNTQAKTGEYDNVGGHYRTTNTRTCTPDNEGSEEVYENVPYVRKDEEKEVIYENLTHLRSDVPLGRPPDESTVDVTGEKLVMKSSSDSMTSDESLVWLSDSWKYNTIKKAPEFNIFEFCDIDQVEGKDDVNKKKREAKTSTKDKTADGKGDSARKREMTLEKGKKILRSKLPLFRWKSDRQNSDNDHKHDKNKTDSDPVVKPAQTSDGVLKPDKKSARRGQDLPESPASIHRSQIQKPSTGNASLGLNDFLQRAEKDDANLCKADGGGKEGGGVRGERGGASTSPAESPSHFVRPRTYKSTQYELEGTSRSPSLRSAKSGLAGKVNKFKQTGKAEERKGERNGRGNMSLGVQSCGSTLISPGQHRPSPSPQMAHRARAKGGEAAVTSIPSPSSISNTSSSSSSSTSSCLPSPNTSGRKVSQKTRRGNLPLESIPFPLSSSSSSSSLSSSLTNVSSSSIEYERDATQGEPLGSLDRKNKSRHHLLEGQEEKKNRKTAGTRSPQIKPPCPRLSDPRRQVCMNAQSTSLRHPRTSQNDLEETHSGPDSNPVSRDPLKHQRQQQQHPINSHPDKKSSASAIASREETPKPEGRTTNERDRRGADTEQDGNGEMKFKEKSGSSTSSRYNTISKKDRRKRKTENDNDADNDATDDDEGDKRNADRETGRRHAPASLASRNGGNFAPPPESSWELKKSPTSRKALRELPYSNNIPGCQRPLPSPSPSCPPSVEDRQGPHSYQYYSLPQLYLGSQDHSQSHGPLERDHHFDASPFKPYYMSDLYRTPIPGISKNRRYSQTSLIDQALESLELSSLTDTECESPAANQRYLQRSNQRQDNSWVSSSRRSSTIATSPVLPPLPAGVLDRVSPEPIKVISTSHEDQTNLASVCILSFDLTLDCEELSNSGFKVVNITNTCHEETPMEDKKSDEKELTNSLLCESNTLEFVDEENTFEVTEEDLMEEIECDDRESDDTVSNRSLSLSIDDKYFENDDFDNVEDTPCDFISEGEQEQLDQSTALLPEKQRNNDAEDHNKKKDATDEDEDFIEIDCDVQPMETLKRPLVYGYGTGPVHSLKGKSFLEKRLSLASDYSEYMEMDIAESLSKQGTIEEVRKKSESCMNLRETYWDYWQAKQGIKGQLGYYSSSESSSNCSPKRPSCPSERFCYDPEVLLAHVRCPKSLEDATFRQYSAYVKSHIYDYFGNVQEALNEYGLSATHRNWISSQPDLLPDTSNYAQMSDHIPLDYSSEPELPSGSGGDSKHRIPSHQLPKRAPPPRPPPEPLQRRDPSQDSGTWTYLQSPQEFALEVSASGSYPVPLPRSTSSLSHIVPNTYNPWQHLLPDITPPRTPRHSIYATAKSKGPVSQSASSSPSRGTHSTIVTSETTRSDMNSHHAPKSTLSSTLAHLPQQSSPSTSSKRSFFPSLSKVVKSPLKRPSPRPKPIEKENSIDVLSELPVVHPSIQKRTHTTTSSKSSSSSSSSSSASSKDSVATVIPAPARNKGPNWLMKHFGGARSKMTAV